MRDALGPLSTDPEFAALFPQDGQPAVAPAQLALVTIMRFAAGLSDRQAADAVRDRLSWTYLLGLGLTDPGFDASVLSEFRDRLIVGGTDALLCETLLAAIHVLNRLECSGETPRHALNTLATVTPAWLRAWVPSVWVDRSARRFEDDRLPYGTAARYALAGEIGVDGALLLCRLYATDAPAWLRAVAAVQVLRQVWLRQFHAALPDTPVCWRTAEDLPPAPLLIGSPYDPDARWSKKRDTAWVGYKVQVTETCDEEEPRLLTNVETTLATTADNTMTTTIQGRLAARDLLPREHIVDTSYVTSDHLVNSHRAGIDLVGPVLGDMSWQARASDGFGMASFVVDWEAQRATCPRGKGSAIWKPTRDSAGHDVINIRFAHADCSICPVRERCVQSKRPRALLIRPREHHEALQAARQRQTTDEFKAPYAIRAEIEGTISQRVRRCDLRRSRDIGLAKTRLLPVLSATALNVVRTAAWLADIPLAHT